MRVSFGRAMIWATLGLILSATATKPSDSFFASMRAAAAAWGEGGGAFGFS